MTNPDLIIEPWQLSLKERMEIFYSAKTKKKKIALYYAKGPDSSTFRYRCFNTYQATLKSKEWQAIFFYKNELKELEKMIPQCDIFVFSRQSRWDGTIKKICQLVKSKNKKIYFDLDDLVFDVRYANIVLNTIGETNLDYWIPYFSDINKTAKNVDGFLTTNEYLGEKMYENFQKPYYVIRNSLNDEQFYASNAYLSLKQKNPNFIIGYFSGSPTHRNDLGVAMPEVLHFLEKHNDAILRVVGLMTFSDSVKSFIEKEKIEFVAPMDFRKLQRAISEVDINIAPLVDNIFTNCKSELKFFEAAAVETTTIASPTFTFKKAIKDGMTGFLCQPGEWYDKLEYLYMHPEENQKIARRAKEYCIKHYYGEEFLQEIESAYNSILESS